jgi:hypothetical protein
MSLSSAKWFRASLGIWGEELRPDEITSRLELKPTRTHIRGEGKSSRNQLVWKDSYWSFDCPIAAEHNPVEHLEWLLDLLEPRAAILKEISARFRVEIWCGFSSENGQGGFTMVASTLKRIANLEIPMTLDLYPPQVEELSEETGE